MPNLPREAVHVTLENGVLTIEGERRQEKEEKGVRYHRHEPSYGSVMRRFTLPEGADESKIDATFKDCLLHVVVAKSKTAKPTKAKQIAIH